MWYWNLIIVLVAIFILWWALTRQASFTETPSHSHAGHVESHELEEQSASLAIENQPEATPVVETRAEPMVVKSTIPDNLVIIEGIGPKIAGILSAAGITTFSQLAATEPQRIKEILTSADERIGRISDPTSWPEQARLAAAGDTEGLEQLQNSLKGGRQNKL
jgi:predicted flap endonuclease-1-like 5' DNA nuclease